MSGKNKSHKGLLKRVRVTGRNKIKHRRRGTSHLNSGLSGDKSRSLHKDTIAHGTVARKLARALHVRVVGPNTIGKKKKS